MGIGIIMTSESDQMYELLPIDRLKSSIDNHMIGLSLAGAEIVVVCTRNQVPMLAQRFTSRVYRDMGIIPKLVITDSPKKILWAALTLGSLEDYTFIGKANTIVPPDTYSRMSLLIASTGVRFCSYGGQHVYPVTLTPPVIEFITKYPGRTFPGEQIKVYGLTELQLPYYYELESFDQYSAYIKRNNK